MAVAVSVRVDGIPEVEAMLKRIAPGTNPKWVRGSMVDCGLLTQKIAAKEMIIQGSRFRSGGKGKLRNAGVHPRKLTSRRGGAGLVGSIHVNRAGLPWSVEVGTDLGYGAVHELGWSGTQRIPSHTRTVAWGRKVAPFKVKAFTRSVTFRARPYLAPGLTKAAEKFSAIFVRHWKKEFPS